MKITMCRTERRPVRQFRFNEPKRDNQTRRSLSHTRLYVCMLFNVTYFVLHVANDVFSLQVKKIFETIKTTLYVRPPAFPTGYIQHGWTSMMLAQ